jgi:hypothetical protein
MSAPSEKSLSPLPLPEIIQRYLNGESLPSLARVCGVSRRTIYNWMYRLGDEEYRALKEQAYFNRIADADEKLANSEDLLHVARNRDECKWARWDAERRLPHLFGPKQSESGTKILVLVNRDQAVKQLDTTTGSGEAEAE